MSFTVHELRDEELQKVSGGMPSIPAEIHWAFGGSASDLIFGDKGFVAEAAKRVAWDILYH